MPRPKFAPGGRHAFTISRPLGRRDLTEYLAGRLSISVKHAGLLVAGDCVRVDGQVCAVEAIVDLQPGRRVEVFFPELWPPHLQPVAMPLDVIYEDDCLCVLNKPAGMVVHPARGHMDNLTLQNGVLDRHRHRLGDPETTIAAPHRLDLDTSGAIVYTLTKTAYRELTRQFFAKEVHKEYLALVDGQPDFTATHVDKPLGVHPQDPARGAVVPLHEGGKEAATDFYVLDSGADWALVRANPLTGRPHQIRLHLAALGLPIMGDLDYHPDPTCRGAQRQMLHAAALVLTHPLTGHRLRFEAPLPEDFSQLRDQLRAGRESRNSLLPGRG